MKKLQMSLASDGFAASMLGAGSSFDEFDVLILPPACDFEGIKDKCRGKTVFAPFCANGVINYLEIDSFKKENAVPSAEGAVYRLMGLCETTVRGMEIAVIGFGCIGKELYRILTCLGAFVTVYARGGKKGTVDISALHGIRTDCIFNTVPAKLLTFDVLSSLRGSPLIIDLASRPGGVDFGAAESLGIKCFQELAIPGRYAPDSAGEILKNTVISYLRGVK